MDISARLLMDIIVESYRFRNEIIYGKGVGIIVDKPSRSGFIDALWDLLQGEIELSGEHTPIDEAIIGFGRFLSRRSTYVMAKRVLSFPNDEAKRTRVLEEEDSSSHEE
ncbi:Fbox protein 47 [Caligus rogercresseyi]|uniref:Fbox protein 47 n=1 Tax=Caligus rogercresseyi TaxID=217165 RepID=A0A7T8QUY0_CALRO|nr:Fbox protein 47 [Caligus rogercresseyi]